MMSVPFPTEYAPAPKGITLYTHGTPNGIKITMALTLLNLPYKLLDISIVNRVNREPWFVQNVNPTGRIPVLIDIDENGEKFQIFESGAVLQYLTDKYDKDHKISFPHGSQLYYESLQWSYYQLAGVESMVAPATFETLFMPKKNELLIKRNVFVIRRMYKALDTQLKINGTGYFVGDHVSTADILTFPWLFEAPALKISLAEEYPNLYNWVQRIYALPGIAKAVETPKILTAFTENRVSTKL